MIVTQDQQQKMQIAQLTEAAFRAMESAYIALRTPTHHVNPDWERNLREKYAGTVYETSEFATISKATHIDPHHWANMQQYVDGAINNIMRPVRKSGVTAPTFESAIEAAPAELHKNKDDLEMLIIIAGLRAAADLAQGKTRQKDHGIS